MNPNRPDTNSAPVSVGGRGWARTGLVLGGLVSVAANVAHSFIPPHSAPIGWHPQVGAVVGAICWPVFLFVAIEILARVAWPSGFGYWLLRFGGMLPVALVAALVSYRHLSGLLAYYGEEPLVYHVGPLAVDGLMVMATAALLAIGHTTHYATMPHGIPAVVTVPDPTFRAPSMPPATIPVSVPATPAPVAVPEPPVAPMPTPAEVATRITPPPAATTGTRPAPAPAPAAPATVQARPAQSAARRAPLAPPATDPPVTAPGAAQPMTEPANLAELFRARQVAVQYRTEHGEPINAPQLARRLKVSSDRATQLLAAIERDPSNTNPSAPTVNGHAMKATR